MSKYDKELDTRTDEYEEAVEPLDRKHSGDHPDERERREKREDDDAANRDSRPSS